ncbi:glycosyltransferase family 1 protein [Serratia sp. M24T3]|uniref:glycosyltransferase family 4 protein n=1 Tax=Serratia sp. M24T3 TaxID=932213 RepID=UPI00025BC8FF|nr:glycosyltransferase family 1 protein [Serratia sp. M24T3]EIC85147.1 group 1 glycosyl transferase [Serratia sp. M24T3]
MHILIDLQGCQSESRFRGIGRYSVSLTKAIIRISKEHKVSILINGMYDINNINDVKNLYSNLIDPADMYVFSAHMPTHFSDKSNHERLKSAKINRDHAIANINPDIVLVTTFFEGFSDNFVVSISETDRGWKTFSICYDLIPLMNPAVYLSDKLFHEFYMDKVKEFENSYGVLSISNSVVNELEKYTQVAPEKIQAISSAVDDEFCVLDLSDAERQSLRQKYHIPGEFLMTIGVVEPRKNIDALIEAYGKLPRAVREQYSLVLACQIKPHNRSYLLDVAKKHSVPTGQIVFTGYLSDEDLIGLYNICRLFVFPSIHEGFGLPPLEAMSCGAATISSNLTSLPEVIGWEGAMFNPRNTGEMAALMERGLTDESFHSELVAHAAIQATKFSWQRSAELSLAAFEKALADNVEKPSVDNDALLAQSIHAFRAIDALDDEDRLGTAWALAQNSFVGHKKKLLVDVSVLVEHDAATGIQRVVRSVLSCLLRMSLPGYEVRPVYCKMGNNYHYANAYQNSKFGSTRGEDEAVLFTKGDVMLVLDLTAHLFPYLNSQLDKIRRTGAQVHFVVYDIIPISQPKWAAESIQRVFPAWLASLAQHADGLVCISESVADEVREWLDKQREIIAINPYLTVKSFHLGADLDASMPSKGMPENAAQVLSAIQQRESFLIVSTIEPRKGHQQALEACELLWAKGVKCNLVIVGKQGWAVEELAEKIRKHPQLNKQLFWLNGISDEFLEMLYDQSSALLVPSFAEGFGLPLIEAAQKDLPLIIRDIPVFKEIAAEHATYFKGTEAKVLSDVLITWIEDSKQGNVPKSSAISWLSWRESTEQLLKQLPL